MGRISELFQNRRNWFSTVILVFVGLYILSRLGGVAIDWIRASLEVSRQEKMMKYYHQQNTEMEKRINMLVTDRDTLEKFAREHFDFAAPGEDVFVIED